MDRDALHTLARQHPEWWAGAVGPITVEPLGRGESFTAHLLRRGGRELVLRVPHTPLEELPQPLTAEAALLARVPEGLTARPVAAPEPSPADPRAYLVTTRVPGAVLPAARWADRTLLASLATQLAHLHHGGNRAGLAVPERIDPVGGAEAARAWWRENEPDAAAAVEPLWPGVRRHQEAATPAFEQISPVLLHGDPAAANLLVDESRTVRFVDWEWAQVGDPARDLGVIGGPIAAEPWYAPLSDDQVRTQAEVYLAERSRLAARSGRREPAAAGQGIEALLTRRTAHLLQEAFFTAAHLHRVAAAGGEGSERAGRVHTVLLDQVCALVS